MFKIPTGSQRNETPLHLISQRHTSTLDIDLTDPLSNKKMFKQPLHNILKIYHESENDHESIIYDCKYLAIALHRF